MINKSLCQLIWNIEKINKIQPNFSHEGSSILFVPIGPRIVPSTERDLMLFDKGVNKL